MAKGRFAGTLILPLAERLARRIVIDDNGCWNWTGATTSNGYGVIRDSQRLGVGSAANLLTHRLSYELHRGPLTAWPKSTLDHLCRNRRCCNPAHLEEVSIAENLRRGREYRRSHQ